MGLWQDFLEGVAEGALNVAAYQAQALRNNAPQGYVGIRQLCRQLDWAITEHPDEMISMRFTLGREERTVYMSADDAPFISFGTVSTAHMRARDIPPEIPIYLLRRNLGNAEICAWSMFVDDDNEVLFRVGYYAFSAGFDADKLQYVCHSLLEEVADFDSKLRQQGLLR